MTLYEGNAGNDYMISGIYVEDNITRRLEALGMNDKTVIHIMTKKKHGAMIIKVRGTRLALGKHIAKSIEVKECV
ncbi:MAG: FeoA domain-containing protein [Lachnospiraceae bacterium]|nr:FeoA domain-containing protein [Lachnospiraceae bacterium]